MALTDYLSFDEVRQSIGVDEDELSDDSLSLPMYATELTIALGAVGDGALQALYTTVAQLDPASRTAQQQQLYDLTRLYAVYSTALACLPGIPLQAMKGEADEKADYTRFGGNVHDQVMARLTTSAERSLLALTALYIKIASLDATPVVRTLFLATGNNYDPITG